MWRFLGKVSIDVDSEWFEPESNSTADQEASEIMMLFTVNKMKKLNRLKIVNFQFTKVTYYFIFISVSFWSITHVNI